MVTTHRAHALVRAGLLGALILFGRDAGAQQFNSDSFWVAPQGVATFTLTAGQEYSLGILTAALFPGWEFNLGATHFVDNPLQLTEGHYSGVLYAKRRFYQNDDETAGFAVMAGTGVNPGHLELGTETDTFTSWWATGALTLPFTAVTSRWTLSVEVSSLFRDPTKSTDGPVFSIKEAAHVKLPSLVEGKVQAKLLTPLDLEAKGEPYLIEIPPKERLSSHFFVHKGEELGYLLKGTLHFKIEELDLYPPERRGDLPEPGRPYPVEEPRTRAGQASVGQAGLNLPAAARFVHVFSMGSWDSIFRIEKKKIFRRVSPLFFLGP